MTLTLTIRNVSSLENGMPTEFVLHRRGASIGRAPTCDWALPDPHRYISSRHCEISFREETYFLADVSTNGTFFNGGSERMQPEVKLKPGDVITIGHYELVAGLSGAPAAAAEPVAAPAEPQSFAGWDKWNSGGGAPPAAPTSDGWGNSAAAAAPPPPAPASAPGASSWASPSESPAAPATSEQFAWGSTPAPDRAPEGGGGWGPSHSASHMPSAAAPSEGSMWQAPEAAPQGASGWSSAAPDRPAAPATDDIWGKISEGNVVDWARGGFGDAPAAAAVDPLGLQQGNPTASFGAAPRAAPVAAAAAPAPRRAPSPAAPAAAPPARTASASGAGLGEFIAATGLDPAKVKGDPGEVLARAGGLLRRLVAGMVVLVEARARAKSQMGAESTRLEFNGNNPIKFARSPDQALAQLLSAPERGFMDSEKAIEDAFFDLQSHQIATLKAMQGALRATLERFSPAAIRTRVGDDGLMKKLVPVARDAALWQAYEKEFGGVAKGSDEAFMDVFSKEFRRAYEEAANSRR